LYFQKTTHVLLSARLTLTTETGPTSLILKLHRAVVWAILADFDCGLLLLLALRACGQRFFSVVHMPTAILRACHVTWIGREGLPVVRMESAVQQFRNSAL
jgi:hypothetical protein